MVSTLSARRVSPWRVRARRVARNALEQLRKEYLLRAGRESGQRLSGIGGTLLLEPEVPADSLSLAPTMDPHAPLA